MNRTPFVLLLFFVGLLSGCAAKPKMADVAVDRGAGRSVRVLSGADGAVRNWDSLVTMASAADVVVIGENHGHPLGLTFAAALWADVLDRSPNAALSLEFFERDEQSRLDEYLAGLTDEKAFRARARRTDGNYPPGHRDMVEAAKKAGRPVIAANAPRPLVSAARKQGYERLRELTPELQRLCRIPDYLPTGRYRNDFDALMTSAPMTGHSAPRPTDAAERERLDTVFRSQSVWDWTMADSIARAAAAGHRPVVQVVGRFHSDFDGGLILALRHIRPQLNIVTISVVNAASESLRAEDRTRGTYVVYVGPQPPDGAEAN